MEEQMAKPGHQKQKGIEGRRKRGREEGREN